MAVAAERRLSISCQGGEWRKRREGSLAVAVEGGCGYGSGWGTWQWRRGESSALAAGGVLL